MILVGIDYLLEYLVLGRQNELYQKVREKVARTKLRERGPDPGIAAATTALRILLIS